MIGKIFKSYELNRKYAVRKLAVGVVSVTLGLSLVPVENVGLGVVKVNSTAKAAEVEWAIRNGNVNVTLDTDGVLTLEPIAGTDGLLEDTTRTNFEWDTILQSAKTGKGQTDKAKIKKIVVKPGVKGNSIMTGAFSGFSNVEEIDLSGLDTTQVTDMSNMFYLSMKVNTLNFGDNFDTGNVTNMTSMFDTLMGMKTLNLGSKFTTKNVTDMSAMFNSMGNLEELYLGEGFDTSKVTNMTSMFSNLRGLKKLDLGPNFDTSNVENMEFMFFHINELKSLNLGNKFNSRNVKTMYRMFDQMFNLEELNLGDNFHTDKVESMQSMFAGTNIKKLDLGKYFNTENVKTMASMFSGMNELEELNLGSKFDTSSVVDMSGMFIGTKKLETLNLGDKFNTSNVANMSFLFDGSGVKNLDLGDKFYTDKATNMSTMFFGMEKLEHLNLGEHFVINSNTATSYNSRPIFANLNSLKSITIPARTNENIKNIFDLLGVGKKWSKGGDPSNNSEIYGEKTLYPEGKYELYITRYEADDKMAVGKKEVGKVVDGVQTIKVGTEPKVETTVIPHGTRYESDDTKERDEKTTIRNGVDGSRVKTTTYRVFWTGDVGSNVPTEKITPAVDEIIEVGTKPKVETTSLPYTTEYSADESKDRDEKTTLQEGEEGSRVKTTTYTLNTNDGTTTENTPTEVETAPKTEKISVGTKPKVETTSLPYITEYSADETKDRDEKTTLQKGEEGSKVKTTTYTLNTSDGTTTENTPTEVETAPMVEKISVGTKPKVETTTLPYTTEYVADDTKERNEKTTLQKGEEGNKVKTTTYTLNTNDGTTTENTPTEVETAPKTEKISVGTKPKVTEEVIAFKEEIRRNAELLKGETKVVQEGVNGRKVTTTTYSLDTTTGKTIAGLPKILEVAAINKIIEVGTKVISQPGEAAEQDELPILKTTRHLIKGTNKEVAEVELEFTNPKNGLIKLGDKEYEYESTEENEEIRTHYYMEVKKEILPPKDEERPKDKEKVVVENKKDNLTEVVTKERILPKTSIQTTNSVLLIGALSLVTIVARRKKESK